MYTYALVRFGAWRGRARCFEIHEVEWRNRVSAKLSAGRIVGAAGERHQFEVARVCAK